MIDEDKIRAKSEHYYDLGKKRLAEKGWKDYRALYDLAVQASGLGRYRESITYLKQVIALKPDFAKAFISMGNIYYNLGQYENALSSYRKAMELDPLSRDAVVMGAQCDVILGESGRAIQNLESLLNKDPFYEKALLLLVAALFIIGERDKGMEHTKELKDKKSFLINYLSDIARLLISRKRTREAQRLLDAVEDLKNRLL
jgi:tetratricopeptide (TPR) repeat protein